MAHSAVYTKVDSLNKDNIAHVGDEVSVEIFFKKYM